MDVKICPACHKENSISASTCAFCGAPLVGLLPSRTTEPVPEQPIKIEPPPHIMQLGKLYGNILVFTVLGQEQPILIKETNRIILGRYSPGEANPSVDLTPYNANLLGVSRQHASITRSEKNYVLQDLDSTNGTWLNETKLVAHKPYPLRSGDLVRLGQLALYVYFDFTQSEQESTIEFSLQKAVTTDHKNQLTIPDLAQSVTPFLNSLTELQKLCDEILGRSPSTISIISLNFDAGSSQIKFKLSGGQEAVRLLSKLNTAEKQPQPVVTQQVGETAQPENQLPVTTASTNGQDAPKPVTSKIEPVKLVEGFVHELAPSRIESERQSFAEKFMPILNSMLENPLKIVDGA